MNIKNPFQPFLWTFAILFASGFQPSFANADFNILSRHSELQVDSTNLGGVEITLESIDLAAPFSAQIQDSATHTEASGNINGGAWFGLHENTVSADLIRAELQSEVFTEQIFGNGIPILDIRNEFEVIFEVTEPMEIELGGTMFGTADVIGANDFVRMRFQQYNGITYLNVHSTSNLDDLNSVFVETLQPGTQYRLIVESHAEVIGEQFNASGVTVCLRSSNSTGDVNRDGLVNLLDVDPFVDAITSGQYDGQADTNCDGVVDLIDVSSFIAILSNN